MKIITNNQKYEDSLEKWRKEKTQEKRIAEKRIAAERETERQKKQAERIAKEQENKEIEESQHQETEEEKERNSLMEYQTRIIKAMNERQEKEQKEKRNQEEQRKKAQEAEKERQAKRQEDWGKVQQQQEQQRKESEDSTKAYQKEIYDKTGTKNGEITDYEKTNSEEEETNFKEKERKFRSIIKPEGGYGEIDKKKIEIGLAGELYVMAFEKERLKAKRRPNLANNIEHVSQTQGDGKGYDILSFTEKGHKMYIEVKTTEKSMNESVFFTQNEMDFMKEHKSQYYLYRVYDFDIATKTGELYILKGYQQVADYFDFKTTQYKGKIKMKIP